MLWKSRAKPRFWAFNDRIRSLLCDRANPLKFAEVAYETSASDRGNPPVGAGRLRFLSTLWHWAFRILVLRLSSLWLLTLRLSNVRVWGVRAAMLCLMECFWLSWVLVLWPIPGLRRFDRDAFAPWTRTEE